MNIATFLRSLRTPFWHSLVARRPTLAEPPVPPKIYRRLERVTLTEGVFATLFEDFERHRQTARGEEEFGWVLLGVRDETSATVKAALPAGAQRHASLTHIQFHSNAQAVATRLLRQTDKTLTMLGVAHTHPGSLRHPSGGDYRGDIRFVTRLRGREGVFAIGTADANGHPSTETHRFIRGRLCFSWYVLAESDDHYRSLPIEIAPGEDLAHSLTPLWPTLETHADSLERLAQQLVGIRFEATEGSLSLAIPLADENRRLRILMKGGDVRYYVDDAGDLASVDPEAKSVDHGVFAILAELARLRS